MSIALFTFAATLLMVLAASVTLGGVPAQAPARKAAPQPLRDRRTGASPPRR